MHDMHGDVLEPMNMVEDVIVAAVHLAVATKKAAVHHVVDQNPGHRQSVFGIWSALAVFIPVQAAGTGFPSHAGRRSVQGTIPVRFAERRLSWWQWRGEPRQ